MASGPRPSTYAEKRSSGMAGFADRASAASASSRPRMSDGHGSASGSGSSSFKTDHKTNSSSRYAESTHKRSASGHPNLSPNANLRSANSSFEERRTERVQVTTRETLINRTKSPPRRSAAGEKSRTADGTRHRGPEPRQREVRQETPGPGTNACSVLRSGHGDYSDTREIKCRQGPSSALGS